MSRVWFWFALFVVPWLAASCGGGGSSAPVTPLPQALAITAATAVEVGVDQPLSSSLGDTPEAGLRLSWDFGDGSPASSAATPVHRYATSGDFTLRLSVTNESGQSATTERSISARRSAWVAGMACNGAQQTGWCTRPVPFIDTEDPRVVGADTVFRRSATSWIGSDDGGRTFTPRLPAADAIVINVHAPDASSAWMLWKNGQDRYTLSRSVDGGRTWNALRSLPAPAGFERQYGLKGLGQQLLLYRYLRCEGRWFDCYSTQNELSLDGGATWNLLPAPLGFNVNVVSLTPSGSVTWVECVETITGFCSRVSGRYAYSLDRGLVVAPVTGTFGTGSVGARAENGDVLLQFSRPEQDTAEATTADWVFWRSENGGRDWLRRVLRAGVSPLAAQPALDTLQIRQRRCSASVCEVLEVTAATSRQRYTSVDGGSTWVPAPALPYLRFDALGDVLLDVTGRRVSVDGGTTWQGLPSSSEPDLSDTLVPTAGVLWLIDRRSSGREADIYRSIDAGRTWSFGYARRIGSLGNVSTAWAFLDGRVLADTGFGPLESTDQGDSWGYIGGGYVFGGYREASRIGFFDAGNGFASRADEIDTVLRSSDGGRSWASLLLPATGLTASIKRDLQAAPDGTYWLAGSESSGGNAIWRLAPQATSWERLGVAPPADTGGLQFTSNSRGYLLSSGLVHRTDDGGRSWQPLVLPSAPVGSLMRALFFADDRIGWLVGDNGRILHTRDSGATWTEQTSGRQLTLVQVGALDAYTVWVRATNVAGQTSFIFSANGGH